MMDYLFAKFGDINFSRFGLTCGQIYDEISESHTDIITEADDRYTDATTVGVSKYY